MSCRAAGQPGSRMCFLQPRKHFYSFLGPYTVAAELFFVLPGSVQGPAGQPGSVRVVPPKQRRNFSVSCRAASVPGSVQVARREAAGQRPGRLRDALARDCAGGLLTPTPPLIPHPWPPNPRPFERARRVAPPCNPLQAEGAQRAPPNLRPLLLSIARAISIS